MAKLSDLFGRKGEELGTGEGLGAITSNGSARPIRIEHFYDVGSRLGEENEPLRALLTDTGRKIGEFDELKQAFNKLVAPFNATLRALEQEKSQTLSPSGMLQESRKSYETLRAEFCEIEKKATALEAESERLREDLELAREQGRVLGATGIELSNEVSTRTAQIAELERQLGQETNKRRNLSENRRTLQEQVDGAEKRIVELEGSLPPRAKGWLCSRTRSAGCNW
jgi:crescentin